MTPHASFEVLWCDPEPKWTKRVKAHAQCIDNA